jgi:hypothetical protein
MERAMGIEHIDFFDISRKFRKLLCSVKNRLTPLRMIWAMPLSRCEGQRNNHRQKDRDKFKGA